MNVNDTPGRTRIFDAPSVTAILQETGLPLAEGMKIEDLQERLEDVARGYYWQEFSPPKSDREDIIGFDAFANSPVTLAAQEPSGLHRAILEASLLGNFEAPFGREDCAVVGATGVRSKRRCTEIQWNRNTRPRRCRAFRRLAVSGPSVKRHRNPTAGLPLRPPRPTLVIAETRSRDSSSCWLRSITRPGPEGRRGGGTGNPWLGPVEHPFGRRVPGLKYGATSGSGRRRYHTGQPCRRLSRRFWDKAFTLRFRAHERSIPVGFVVPFSAS